MMIKEQLEEEILLHNKLYWEDNDPKISDEEFDQLILDLKSVAPNSEVLSQVHSASSGRPKVVHENPLLSLDKVHSPTELITWARKVARSPEELFILSSKKDGLSAEYKHGQLMTRGDGTTGFLINDRIPYITGLKSGRGEILVTKEDFKKGPVRSGGDAYKSERSAASGLVNNLGEIAKGFLTFVPFHIDGQEYSLSDLEDASTQDWKETVDEFRDGPYPIDGLVLSLKDEEYGLSLGSTSHHPRHSVAYKLANPTGITKIKDIRWTCGKSRKLTPTAILEPVEISGFMNSKASLHNYMHAMELGVSIGDEVEVERCNEIIPQIKRVVTKSKYQIRLYLKNCPSCGASTVIKEPELMCSNEHCAGALSKDLQDAINRIGLEKIGPAIVNSLYVAGFDTLPKLLRMQENDWLALEGFAEKSAADAFRQVKNLLRDPMPDYKLLAAQNIPGIGLTLSKAIMDVVSMAELRGMSVKELQKIEGIGEERARLLVEGVTKFNLTTLLQMFNVITTKGMSSRKTVCFTGADTKHNRSDWIHIANGKGFDFARAVTKKLDLLVCANVTSGSSKLVKAEKYGIEVMTYDEFEKI